MRKTVLAVAVLLSSLGAGSVLADEDDCRTTMSEWQPREAVVATVEGFGWQVRRVKVDDGCYEVKGRDADGNDVCVHFTALPEELEPNEVNRILNTVTDAINRGAIYRFLTKPWNDDELREHIRQAFRTHDEKRRGGES